MTSEEKQKQLERQQRDKLIRQQILITTIGTVVSFVVLQLLRNFMDKER